MIMENEVKVDRIGIILSALCLIHCITTPLVGILAPWLHGIVDNVYLHLFFFFFVFPIALYAFYHGAKNHNDYFPLKVGGLGVALLVLGMGNDYWGFFGGSDHVAHNSHVLELTAHLPSIIGSALLVLAHYRNLKNCRCDHQHH